MTELVEDDIMGEDLDYEEYDLDDEEEEALLAPNEESYSQSKLESIQISLIQDEAEYPETKIMDDSVSYHLEEKDDGTVEEEDDDEDDYDSKSRDRFKSERTKVSLTKPSISRNIPDSLDDVKTTDVVPDNKKKFKNKQNFQEKRNKTAFGRVHPYQRDNYQNNNNFNNWERSQLMGMPPPPLISPHFGSMMNVQHLHGPPIRIPPSAYGSMYMQGSSNPYMMNAPQIPEMSLKQTYNNVKPQSRLNAIRTFNQSPNENKQNLAGNGGRQNNSNPNLKVINTIDRINASPRKPPVKIVEAKKVAASDKKPLVLVAKKLNEEEAEYERKLEEQKKKREEILAKKEMRRKEAANKAKANAPPTVKAHSNPPDAKGQIEKKKRAKEVADQRREQKRQLLEGFHGKAQLSDEDSVRNHQRDYQETFQNRTIRDPPPFALRNLAGPPIHRPTYSPPINTSIPPPGLNEQDSHFFPSRLVGRPPGTPPFIPPPGLPHRLHDTIQQQQPPFSSRFIPDIRPMSVSLPVYPSASMDSRRFPPNIPPSMAPQYMARPPLRTAVQAPTITLNFPPPPLNRSDLHMSSVAYQERGRPLAYAEEPIYDNNDVILSRNVISPEPNSEQPESVVQRYKWNNLLKTPVRNLSSGNNITINTAEKYEVQPVKKIKKFKRIIRKNKNGDVLLIKKLVLDGDGNPTGVEEVEFMHDDLVVQTAPLKKLTAGRTSKKSEPVQQKGNISKKHFRSNDDSVPINRMGEGVRKTTYSNLGTSKPVKRLVTTIAKSRHIRPVRCSSHTVLLKRIPSNVTVDELKDLADDEGLESPKSILYDRSEKKCSFEFTNQQVAFKFCKKMNGRMMKMSIIYADVV